MKNRQEINEWLFKNWRKLASPCYSFYGDNNQNKQEEFDNATLKVLVCFLSTGKTRSVSNTFNALYHNIKLAGDGVFADYCYYPEEADKEVLKANDVPYMFGNVSHAPYTDYDLIMVSHSIVPEMLNFTSLYDGSDIPLTVEERLQKKDMPLVIYGGAAANESSMVLGPIYNEDGSYRGKSLVDICTYGYAENNLEHVVRFFKEWKESGKSCTKDKVELMDAMIDNKVQEGKVFYPLHYEWVYADDKFTIKEIKCTDNRLNKTIKYNRIDQEAADKGLGWSTKVFNLDGENSSSVDVQVSSGCSGQSSVCSFCISL